jgi:uncharacterized membrane protein
MKAWLWAYAAALLVIGVLDGLWLGFVARDFYRNQMASIAAPEVRLVPAALFYFLYPAALLALALVPAPADGAHAAARAALVGLACYGTYELTNLATLRQWSWQLAAVDMAWGTALSAAAGVAAFLAWQRASAA